MITLIMKRVQIELEKMAIGYRDGAMAELICGHPESAKDLAIRCEHTLYVYRATVAVLEKIQKEIDSGNEQTN